MEPSHSFVFLKTTFCLVESWGLCLTQPLGSWVPCHHGGWSSGKRKMEWGSLDSVARFLPLRQYYREFFTLNLSLMKSNFDPVPGDRYTARVIFKALLKFYPQRSIYFPVTCIRNFSYLYLLGRMLKVLPGFPG